MFIYTLVISIVIFGLTIALFFVSLLTIKKIIIEDGDTKLFFNKQFINIVILGTLLLLSLMIFLSTSIVISYLGS